LDIGVELGLFSSGVAGSKEDHVALFGGGTDELVSLHVDFSGVNIGGEGFSGAEMSLFNLVTVMSGRR